MFMKMVYMLSMAIQQEEDDSMSEMQDYVDSVLARLEKENPEEKQFHNTVKKAFNTLVPVLEKNPKYKAEKILERFVEPERVVMFRVPWTDDNGELQINRGWRVQMNSAIGPYKGGLRFHPSVSVDILKFLAFEQTFKNALSGLPIGGGSQIRKLCAFAKAS